MKKTSNYYGTYMRVLQEMPKKTQRLLWKPYAGITRNVIKTQQQPWIDMRVLQRMKNVSNYLWPICGYCKRCQINQRLLWDLYAGIAYLKISL